MVGKTELNLQDIFKNKNLHLLFQIFSDKLSELS